MSDSIFRELEENVRQQVRAKPTPAPSVMFFDVDGIPVSYEPERDDSPKAWDGPAPRPVSLGFARSEGVPISRERFEELRRSAKRRA